MSENLFDELRRQSQRLSGLLSDPHPGLFTWMGAVSECCLAIGDLGGVGKVSTMPELLAQLKALAVQLEAAELVVPPNVTTTIAKAEGREVTP